MARIRKENGHIVKKSIPKDALKSQGKKQKQTTDILALGGSAEDAALLKNIDNSITTGTVNNDPSLQNDVSQFLKDLSLKGNQVKDTKGKGKEKTKSHQENLSTPTKHEKTHDKPTKKDKKEKKVALKAETSAPTTSQQPSQVEEKFKVILPTKVSLNPKSQFVFQPTSQWYAALPALQPTPSSMITPNQLSELSTKAAALHEQDINTFLTASSSNSSSSEASFLSKIIQSGTLSDRLSALTLLVQSSPLHNIKALENLKQMAERGKGKGGREESLKALRCIVDWWTGGGAPSRKLKYFRDQPLLNAGVTDEYLLLWHFEDWLKKYFFSVLQILETLSLDPLPYVRTQTINLIFILLRDTPEQEQNLLRLLVNKLGDTEKSVASRTSYHLLQLLQSHPAMKAVIVREIISLVLRPTAAGAAPTSSTPASNKHIRFGDAEPSKPKTNPAAKEKLGGGNAHARYYSTVTFNQIVLTPADREVALQLIDVYFEMFKELLGEGKEEESEETGKVEQTDAEKSEFKADKSGRIRDAGKGKGKGKGKQIEVKGAAGFTEVEDSSSKLISAILTGVNRALPFAKIDASDVGINKHIDTLFLITHTSTFNISLQALVLIQQITVSLSNASTTTASSSSTAKSITDRYYRTLYASLHDGRLATSSKQAMYLNLFFKSVKADAGNENNERIKALIRRFLQVLVSGGGGATEFIAGGLYLLGELFSTIPGLRSVVNEKPKETSEPYDPRKRDPQYAHSSALPLWELTPLLNHYHPAVALHARQLLTSQPLTASADLSQNTLSHFLDRFVYKNPKKVKEGEAPGGKGASAMQPAASAVEGVKLIKGEVAQTMVNEPAFLKKKPQDVPVDQLFFHQYFTRKDEREKARAAKANKRKDDEEDSGEEEEEEDIEEGEATEEVDEVDEASNFADEDEDEDNSDLDEDEVWKVMQATMPKAAGDDDDLLEDSEMDEDDDDVPLDFDDDSDLNPDKDLDAGEDNDDDDDGLSLVEASDNEDLISLDGDVPDGLIEYDGSDSDDDDAVGEEDVWGGISTSEGNNKKRKREETKGEKRKKLRSLPTFASYEDYAKMIEDGPEDDI